MIGGQDCLWNDLVPLYPTTATGTATGTASVTETMNATTEFPLWLVWVIDGTRNGFWTKLQKNCHSMCRCACLNHWTLSDKSFFLLWQKYDVQLTLSYLHFQCSAQELSSKWPAGSGNPFQEWSFVQGLSVYIYCYIHHNSCCLCLFIQCQSVTTYLIVGHGIL